MRQEKFIYLLALEVHLVFIVFFYRLLVRDVVVLLGQEQFECHHGWLCREVRFLPPVDRILVYVLLRDTVISH